MSKAPLHEQISTLVSWFMAMVYIGGGIFLITSSYSFGFLKPGSWERIVAAILLIAYGIFRGSRAWKTTNRNS